MTTCRSIAATAMLMVAACQSQTGDAPGNERPYDGIAEGETLHFMGTEPFWGGEVAGNALTYTTPENQTGERIAVERFAGRGGVSFTGTHNGAEFVLMATPSECSDGMSDRSYPFMVTLGIGEETRNGCGWTGRQPFQGPAHP